ncbi:MAG: ParB/RepB/Spo0J family partition protein [Candidatus Bathyarchaeia archaeon]
MAETVKEIELNNIRPSRLNPRLELNIERLNELASSIREVGLLEPIIVRPVGTDEYEVVVGERRYRASQQAGLRKVPAIVRAYSDDEVVQLNLIENIQREDLNAVEKGKVCKYLLENCREKYPSKAALAEKIGVSVNAVSLWLQAADVIPEEAQRYVAPSTISGQVPEGKVDYQTAVAVGRSVKEPEKKVEVIRKLAEERLPVKERKEIIKKVALEPEKPIEKIVEDVRSAPFEMLFVSEDKKPLLEGVKTQSTCIETPDPKVKVGAIARAIIWEPHIADLRITAVERKKLKYFDEEDAKREGGYTLNEFKRKWIERYGEWDENQLVYIIRFEKLK